MGAVLTISSFLVHDGDQVVRYGVALQSCEFAASTAAWGNVDDHLKLAAGLESFPVAADSIVNYQFGTPGSGACQLHFHCTDALGHVGLWATFSSPYPVGRTERHETASIFMRCDPSAIDSFVAALRQFVAGSANRAELLGLEA